MEKKGAAGTLPVGKYRYLVGTGPYEEKASAGRSFLRVWILTIWCSIRRTARNARRRKCNIF